MDIQLQLQQQKGSHSGDLTKRQLMTFKRRERIIIGRDDDCDLTLPCSEKIISRHHARILKKGQQFILTDTSANGTFLNGSKQAIGYNKSAVLKSNDSVHIGQYTLVFNPKTIQAESQQTVKPHSPGKNSTSQPKNIEAVSTPQPTPGLIPQDWNAPVKKPAKKNTNTVQKKAPLATHHESQYIDELLKGLGVANASEVSQHITPAKMFIIGRCLQTTLKSMVKQREHVEKVRSTLRVRKNTASTDKQPDFDALLRKILDNGTDSSAILPMLMEYHRQLIEEQTAIYKRVHKASGTSADELTPLTSKRRLLPDMSQWGDYTSRWREQCVEVKNRIQTHVTDYVKKLNRKSAREQYIKRTMNLREHNKRVKKTRI